LFFNAETAEIYTEHVKIKNNLFTSLLHKASSRSPFAKGIPLEGPLGVSISAIIAFKILLTPGRDRTYYF